jgi:hypothetical protein
MQQEDSVWLHATAQALQRQQRPPTLTDQGVWMIRGKEALEARAGLPAQPVWWVPTACIAV